MRLKKRIVSKYGTAPRGIGTHHERAVEQVRIGRLDRAATIAALAEPAEDPGRPLTEDAVHLVAEESQDYPYFIQRLGSAVWDAAERTGAAEISEPGARQGIAAATHRRNERSCYLARPRAGQRVTMNRSSRTGIRTLPRIPS